MNIVILIRILMFAKIVGLTFSSSPLNVAPVSKSHISFDYLSTYIPDSIVEGSCLKVSLPIEPDSVYFGDDMLALTKRNAGVSFFLASEVGERGLSTSLTVYYLGTMYGKQVEVKKGDFVEPKLSITRYDSVLAKYADSLQDLAYDFQIEKESMYSDFVYPTSNHLVNSPYGKLRAVYDNGRRRYHKGVDYGPKVKGSIGDDIFAVSGGIVKRVSYDERIYGHYVIVDHGGAITSSYLHLSKVSVKEGDTVSTGQQIGKMGATGNAKGSHLHFTLRVSKKAIDYEKFMKEKNQILNSITSQ